MGNLILLRHGQSRWNVEGRFTGWVDIPLTAKGIEEAKLSGRNLSQYDIDIVFTSALSRAFVTAALVCREQKNVHSIFIRNRDQKGYQEDFFDYDFSCRKKNIPLFSSAYLNERFYGDLQGIYKKEAEKKWGKEQVLAWRRGFSVRPPGGESLLDACERILPFFQETIVPLVAKGRTVLVVAHMNSLRAILMIVEKQSSETIVNRELKTGEFCNYEYSTSWGAPWGK